MPPAPTLRRAEPLVSASGVPSSALPQTPSTTGSDQPYKLLQTVPRRHRSLRDKVGSRLKKLLARAKSFTAPDVRVRMHPEDSDRPRAREYEDLPGGGGGVPRAHRRTLSDTSQFIDSVRRLSRRSLSSVPSPSPNPPSIDSSSGELAEKPAAPLELGGLHPNPTTTTPGRSPNRRPLTLIQTRSHASSTPRVEEEDEHALEAYNSESQAETFLTPSFVPESPTTYRDDGTPYVVPGANASWGEAGRSLFPDERGSTEGTSAEGHVEPVGDHDLTPGAGPSPPKALDFAPGPNPNANQALINPNAATGGSSPPATAPATVNAPPANHQPT
ncbi:hypothetical protein FRC09_018617, partial [Ceratobasidium sp. 395]